MPCPSPGWSWPIPGLGVLGATRRVRPGAYDALIARRTGQTDHRGGGGRIDRPPNLAPVSAFVGATRLRVKFPSVRSSAGNVLMLIAA
jgi:hypothetical protein